MKLEVGSRQSQDGIRNTKPETRNSGSGSKQSFEP